VAGGTLELAGVTLTSNASTGTGAVGGNLAVFGFAAATVTDSIIAGGSATKAGTENCTSEGTIHSLGYNIEDRNQCSLGATGDQVNTNPLLGALQDNGGLGVFTEAPPFNSPAVDRGNPTGCNNALGIAVTSDQRGTARGTPCDVGAFEGSYPPTATSATTISGTPATGQALTCTAASFSGAAPITIAYEWLRDGTPIPGATAWTYGVSDADAGHLLACLVTATDPDGSTTSRASVDDDAVPGTTAAGVAAPAVAVISSVTQSARKWREGKALAQISRKRLPVRGRKRLPVGTKFFFALNVPASVSFAFTQQLGGRKVKGQCVAQTKKNSRNRACRRTVTRGTLSFAGHSGTNKVSFQGRISHSKKLGLGSYMLVITATNAAGQRSSPRQLRFTIVK
jgi:hypothetical protein